MKVAMPLIRHALDIAGSNPALLVLIASLSVPLYWRSDAPHHCG